MTPKDHDSSPETALAWHRAGRGAVLATVVETWGSAPRRAGAQMAVSGDGAIVGSVSGGCVEGAVVTEALEALAEGAPRLLSYGVSDGTALAAGLACGGSVRILVEPVGDGPGALAEATLAGLCADRAARRPVVQAVQPKGWQRRLLRPGEDGIADERLRLDRSGPDDTGRILVVHNPPLRLIVVGAGHIAQPLVAMARLAGFDSVVVDPRAAFATQARFPGETVLDTLPDEAIAALAADARTAIVTLSHDQKIDDPALVAALATDAFYIGSLGSSRTHARRVERLLAVGFAPDRIARIDAPVGLAIGAQGPAEIAVSILAAVIRRVRLGAAAE